MKALNRGSFLLGVPLALIGCAGSSSALFAPRAESLEELLRRAGLGAVRWRDGSGRIVYAAGQSARTLVIPQEVCQNSHTRGHVHSLDICGGEGGGWSEQVVTSAPATIGYTSTGPGAFQSEWDGGSWSGVNFPPALGPEYVLGPHEKQNHQGVCSAEFNTIKIGAAAMAVYIINNPNGIPLNVYNAAQGAVARFGSTGWGINSAIAFVALLGTFLGPVELIGLATLAGLAVGAIWFAYACYVDNGL